MGKWAVPSLGDKRENNEQCTEYASYCNANDCALDGPHLLKYVVQVCGANPFFLLEKMRTEARQRFDG